MNRWGMFLKALFYYVLSSTAQPMANNYNEMLLEINKTRSNFYAAYENASSMQKDSVIASARTYLLSKITSDIFPQWYGTPWDFYGTTRIPGQGKIACGYFVTTVLQDAGFNIPRNEWAKLPSEVFIRKLSPDAHRFSSKTMGEIKRYFLRSSDGLYLAGLDNHVGFVWVQNNEIKFIHSNYYQPEIGVMSQDIDSDNPFFRSNYRVIGKLFSDEMIIKWISNSVF